MWCAVQRKKSHCLDRLDTLNKYAAPGTLGLTGLGVWRVLQNAAANQRPPSSPPPPPSLPPACPTLTLLSLLNMKPPAWSRR